MSARFLSIRLITSARIGITAEDPSGPDVVFPVDPSGLPFIPQRRLNARLRDASVTACSAYPDDTPIHHALFGRPGQIGAERALLIGDALLPDTVRGAVEDAIARETAAGVPHRTLIDQITHALSVEEVTTSVNDDSAPVTGTLRRAREVRAGLVFTTAVTLNDPDGTRLRALARACLAVEQLGGGESRGTGIVEVSIDGDIDLTIALATGDPAATPPAAPVGTAPATSPPLPAVASDEEPGIRCAELTLHLTEDLVLSGVQQRATGWIPGTALRGAVAAAADTPELLEQSIVSGVIGYADAFPVGRDETATRRADTLLPLYPPPVTAYTNDNGHLVDTLDTPTASTTGTLRRVPGHMMFTADGTRAGGVRTRIVQRLNRGQDLYFESTILPRGHQFRARLIFHGTALQQHDAHTALHQVLERGLRIGGNARSGFGGGITTRLSPLATLPALAFTPSGDQVDLVLRSPALVRDFATGRFDPHALPDHIRALVAHHAGIPTVDVLAAAIDTVPVGGFATRYSGERPTHTAAAAGSVIRLALPPDTDIPWQQILAERVGERTLDGFGELALSAPLAGTPRLLAMTDTTRVPDPPGAAGNATVHHGAATALRLLRTAPSLTSALPEPIDLGPVGLEPVVAGRPSAVPDPGRSWGAWPRLPRLEVGFQLTLLSDTTLSTGDTDPADKTDDAGAPLRLIRDPDTGAPVLRGTTLAGVLRHHLRRQLGATPDDPDPADVEDLFGAAISADTGRQSTITVFDAAPTGPVTITTRTGNRIDPDTRIIDGKALFSREVVPAGTTFSCRWVLRPPTRPDEAAAWWRALVTITDGLDGSAPEGAPIRLGVASGRGRGMLTSSHWAVQLYDIGDPAGFEAYYRHPSGDRAAHPPTGTAARFSDVLAELGSCRPAPYQAAWALHVHARLRNAEPTRLGVPGQGFRPGSVHYGIGPDADDPHNNQRGILTRPHRGATSGFFPTGPLDPGTAWHSLLRRTALGVLDGIITADGDTGNRRARAQTFLDSVFGSDTPTPSRITETDSPLEGGRVGTATRIRIDPLTQGTVDGALFEDDAVFGGASTLHLLLRRPEPAERGLVWAILRDLRDGVAPTTGGLASVGHGRKLLTELTTTLTTSTGDTQHTTLQEWADAKDTADDYQHLIRAILDDPDTEPDTEKNQ